MTTLTDLETIRIPHDSLYPALLMFISCSALNYCTRSDTDGDTIKVTPVRPVSTLSSGEQLLWSLLASLVDGDLRKAFGLDSSNLTAVVDVLTVGRDLEAAS